MELRHLRYFLAAAEEQHFGRAADALFVTRPAVSQTISDLELELGVQLFMRHAHKVTLTDAGSAFQKHARAILQDLTRAVDVTKRIGQGKSGYLTLGYGTLTLLHPLFRAAVKQFGRRCSAIELSLQEMPSSAQIPAVRAGKLDAGFVYVAEEAIERPSSVPEFMSLGSLDSLKISEGWLAVALPSDHSLAGQDSVGLSDLAEEGFIIVQRSNVSPSLSRLSSMCLEVGFSPRVVQEVANIATQINLISVGMGVGLVVASPHLQYPESVRIRRLRDMESLSRFCLVWRSGFVEPALQNFIDTVRDQVVKDALG